MLSNDPKRLKFLGIDLHSRTRRRWVVVLAYLAYVSAMAAIGTAAEGREAFPSEHLLLFLVSFGFLLFGPLGGIRGPVKDVLDERELAERNRASHRALRFLGLMLTCAAVTAALNWTTHRNSGDMTAIFLQFAVTALTLPQAIILWNEPDPRRDLDLKIAPASSNPVPSLE